MRTVLILIFALFFAGIWGAFSLTTETPAEAATKTERRAIEDAKWAAIEACRSAVQRSANYPAKTDFYAQVTAVSDDNVTWSVIGRVDLMNGFGAMIPHRYGCVVDGATVVSAGVDPG